MSKSTCIKSNRKRKTGNLKKSYNTKISKIKFNHIYILNTIIDHYLMRRSVKVGTDM